MSYQKSHQIIITVAMRLLAALNLMSEVKFSISCCQRRSTAEVQNWRHSLEPLTSRSTDCGRDPPALFGSADCQRTDW